MLLNNFCKKAEAMEVLQICEDNVVLKYALQKLFPATATFLS